MISQCLLPLTMSMVPLPQSEWTLEDTTPGGGVFSTVSPDGTYLYHGRGAAIDRYDAGEVRQIELTPPGTPVPFPQPEVWELDASITAMLEFTPFGSARTLYVGAGDESIVAIHAVSGSQAILDDLGGQYWCFDLEERDGLLFALLGALDDNQIRVYDPATGDRIMTYNLEWAPGAPVPVGRSVAYSMAFFEHYTSPYVYLAMGAAGLARAELVGDLSGPTGQTAVLELQPGPSLENRDLSSESSDCDCFEDLDGDGTDETNLSTMFRRARDIDIESGWLFCAAESAGLGQLKLSRFRPGRINGNHGTPVEFWHPVTEPEDDDGFTLEPLTPVPGCTEADYPIRVEALATGDPDAEIMVVVGAASFPGVMLEAFNYRQYTSFDWEPGWTEVDPNELGSLIQEDRAAEGCRVGRGCGLSLHVTERDKALYTNQVLNTLSYRAQASVAGRGWASLAAHLLEEPDPQPGDPDAVVQRLWGYNHEFRVWNWKREQGAPIAASTFDYVTMHPAHSAGQRSLCDPNLILAALDGKPGDGVPFFRAVDDGIGGVELAPVSGTTGEEFDYPALKGQWLDSDGDSEWLVAGALPKVEEQVGGQTVLIERAMWRFIRFEASDVVTTWRRFKMEFPIGWDPGRSQDYAHGAVDPRPDSNIVAMSGWKRRSPVILYDRTEVEAAADDAVVNDNKDAQGVYVLGQVDPVAKLVVHDEPAPGGERLNYRTRYFDWVDSGGTVHTILGVAARGPVSELPDCAAQTDIGRVLFFDLTAFKTEADGNGGEVHPFAQAPIGRVTDAFAFGVMTLDVPGSADPHQFCFVGDFSGQLTVFDLTDGFAPLGPPGVPFAGTLPPPVLPQQMAGSPPEPVTWTLPVNPLDGFAAPLTQLQAWDGDLYVAANRAGVVRLRPGFNQQDEFVVKEIETINTPSQAGGLLIGNFYLGAADPCQPDPCGCDPCASDPGACAELLLVFDHDYGGIKVYRRDEL